MKLRLDGHSIRLRLSPSDLTRLGEEGYIEQAVHLRGGTFGYTLRATDDVDDLDASLEGTSLLVRLPADWIPEWIASDNVGFEATIPLEGERFLHLVVEKDFRCLHKEATASDAFPHPDG